MSDDIFEDLVPYADRFMECAHLRDRAGMDQVLADVQHQFGVPPGEALAVVLAELYFVDRERLDVLTEEIGRVANERDKFARNYLDQKNRVQDLRAMLNAKAGTSPAGRKKVSA